MPLVLLHPFRWAWCLLLLCLLATPIGAQEGITRVAVVPMGVYSAQDVSYLVLGIRDMLTSRLAAPDTVLIDLTEIEVAAADLDRPLTAASAAQLAERLGADFVIFGSLTQLGDRFSLNWQILDAADPASPTGLARTATEEELIAMVDELAGLARQVITGAPLTVLVARPQATPVQTEPQAQVEAEAKESPLFSASDGSGAGVGGDSVFVAASSGHELFGRMPVSPRPLGLSAGDVTGDGSDEIVVFSEKDLSIFSLAQGRPVPITRLRKPMAGRMIMASAGDIDGDGVAEIALTSVRGELPQAAVFRLDGVRLVKLASLARHHLRIVSSPEGSLLVGQAATMSNLFSGAFHRFSLTGGKLVKGGLIPGQRHLTISTLVLADLDGDGATEILGLGWTEKLTVVSATGKVLFRSGDAFGGTNNTFSSKEAPSEHDMGNYYFFNAPLIVTDLNDDGQSEVLVVHNSDTARRIIGRTRFYKKGRVTAMTWDGASLWPAWWTPQIPDYVAASVVVKTASGKGRYFVIAVTEPRGFSHVLRKAKGYLLVAEPTTSD